MAAVSASLVKELRDITNAGMMDCKKALTEADGDLDAAIKILREKGLAAAVKRSGKIAAEGLISALVSPDGNRAIIIEVNSETDFVAKNDTFKKFVATAAQKALDSDSETPDTFFEEKWDDASTVSEALSQMISTIGENIKIRRFRRFIRNEGCVLSAYIHAGGRVAVITELEVPEINETANETAKIIALQIASMRPLFLSTEDVDPEYLEKEKEIARLQTINENDALPEEKRKPVAILEKMLDGRVRKSIESVTLLEQLYIKDDTNKLKVKDYLKSVGKDVKVKRFVRFETGEGVEKKVEDFADEVNKLIN
jgi:elongation factor Ts